MTDGLLWFQRKVTHLVPPRCVACQEEVRCHRAEAGLIVVVKCAGSSGTALL